MILLLVLFLFIITISSSLNNEPKLFFSIRDVKNNKRSLSEQEACELSLENFGSNVMLSCSPVTVDVSAFGSELLAVPNVRLSRDDILLSSSEDQSYSVHLRLKSILAEDEMIYDVLRTNLDTNSVETLGIAVFVKTEKGISGNIPTSTTSFSQIAPCEGIDCHTLTTISTTALASSEDSSETDAHTPSDANITTPDENPTQPDAKSDPMCSQGTPSNDMKFCCPKSCSSCSPQSCSLSFSNNAINTRPCNLYPAPCFMMVIQRVTVAYTQQSLYSTNDITGVIKLALAETNAAYENSNIPIKLVLADTYLSWIQDSGDSYDMLQRFRGSDRKSGNIAILLSANLDSCGRAFLDCTKYSADTCAYGIVRLSCATGYYSFGHEIGHIQGADHNAEVSPYPGRFPDNRGLVLKQGFGTDGAYRTIMAYALIDETRILYFSNPSVMVQGIPTGISNSANNARVLRATRYDVAALNGVVQTTIPPIGINTEIPTLLPTPKPSSNQPTSAQPTSNRPTSKSPTTSRPSTSPSVIITESPTITNEPTLEPTVRPTRSPRVSRPTKSPSTLPPSDRPSSLPVISRPSTTPTASIKLSPTTRPTSIPTFLPTTKSPSHSPNFSRPSASPTKSTRRPTQSPSSSKPSITPSTSSPSDSPTKRPSQSPRYSNPTRSPVTKPPTFAPSLRPSSSPATSRPTRDPTSYPSNAPRSSRPTRSPQGKGDIASFSPSSQTPSSSPQQATMTPSPTRPIIRFTRFPTVSTTTVSTGDELPKNPNATSSAEGYTVSSVAAAGIPFGLVSLALGSALILRRRRLQNSKSAFAEHQQREFTQANQLTIFQEVNNTFGDQSEEFAETSNPLMRIRRNSALAMAQASPPRGILLKHREKPLGAAGDRGRESLFLKKKHSHGILNPPRPKANPPKPPEYINSTTVVRKQPDFDVEAGDFDVFTPPQDYTVPRPPSPPPAPPLSSTE